MALLSYVNPAGRRMMLHVDALVVNRVVAEKVVSQLRFSLSWSPFFVERFGTKLCIIICYTPKPKVTYM